MPQWSDTLHKKQDCCQCRRNAGVEQKTLKNDCHGKTFFLSRLVDDLLDSIPVAFAEINLFDQRHQHGSERSTEMAVGDVLQLRADELVTLHGRFELMRIPTAVPRHITLLLQLIEQAVHSGVITGRILLIEGVGDIPNHAWSVFPKEVEHRKFGPGNNSTRSGQR